ncbi:hypothetical protein P0O24_01890 [Methanotrichaceae archaeon M04Ac]|uniref:Uncharacterized protein n=1 Tax=Candidatus Methanocrinis alkalitolerans TaxID=3033395 RepID=A0ABT5XCA4_9EURY|nr:hypothetical protein [Candidatus Methanocrinis alkalitolerans]MCR3882820.1 hypothetical protein [Methanothrix sp.]MDF0592334.1 hypothetical protein [Candidatus Methanocrinis alkalitolerans]
MKKSTPALQMGLPEWAPSDGRRREVYVRWGESMPPEERVTEIQVPGGR